MESEERGLEEASTGSSLTNISLPSVITIWLEKWFPKYGSWVRSFSITQKFVQSTNSWALLQTSYRNSGGRAHQSVSTTLPGVLTHARVWEPLLLGTRCPHIVSQTIATPSREKQAFVCIRLTCPPGIVWVLPARPSHHHSPFSLV